MSRSKQVYHIPAQPRVSKTRWATNNPLEPRAGRLANMAQGLWALMGFVLAAFFLNLVLTFQAIWPTVYVQPSLRLSAEVVALVALLGLAALAGYQPGRKAAWFLAFLGLVLALGHYANSVVPNLLGRPVNLYWDVPQIPRFVWVTLSGLPVWASIAAVLGTSFGVFFALWAMRLAVQALAGGVGRFAHSWVFWLIVLALLAFTAPAYRSYVPPGSPFPHAVLPTYLKELAKVYVIASPERAAKLLPTQTAVTEAFDQAQGIPLAALANRDVTLIFLETYGAVLYDQAAAREAVQPQREAWEAAIQASGQQVVSAFFKAPTIGGASDLSHLSVLSGIDLTDPRRHDILLTTQKPTLINLFQREGYEVFGVYHSVSWDWVERVFYRYDQYLSGPDLNYQGPEFGFWKIPDQYALPRTEQLFPRDEAAKPRFTVFPTISSHFPFHQVPPFQPDFERLLGPEPFDPEEAARAQAEQVKWHDMRQDYYRSINYLQTWLAGYFQQPEPRETVYIMVGDHQPTGSVVREDVPWDVPVFIVSRDQNLLARFKAQGFSDGMQPASREVLGGLHDLTGMLLQGFGQ